MDDVNINKICLGTEEVELDGEEWIKLSWISSDDDGNFQSSEAQEVSDTVKYSAVKYSVISILGRRRCF